MDFYRVIAGRNGFIVIIDFHRLLDWKIEADIEIFLKIGLEVKY